MRTSGGEATSRARAPSRGTLRAVATEGGSRRARGSELRRRRQTTAKRIRRQRARLPFLVVNAIVAIVAFLVTATALQLLLRSRAGSRLVAVPTDERWHEQATPTFGGIGSTRASSPESCSRSQSCGRVSSELGGIVAGTTIVFAAGLVDDLRHLSRSRSWRQQIAAAVIVLARG